MEENQETIRSITERVAKMSTEFERNNSELKRKYLLWNIEAFNIIASKVRGSFGTGYPFYALDSKLEGVLPIIQEQVSYNRQLIVDGRRVAPSIWECKSCLKRNYSDMPDLKVICKPCPNVEDNLKPRKIINRLPDIDMWLVCDDDKVELARTELVELLKKNSMRTSDIDPIASIEEFGEITRLLREKKLPSIFLPIDCHIIEYSKIKGLIERTPNEIREAKQNDKSPFLPIQPISYRKNWQSDEVYNFIYDFLSAFTPFSFSQELQEILDKSRRVVATENNREELFEALMKSATSANARRFDSIELENIFLTKMDEWSKIEEKKSEKLYGE